MSKLDDEIRKALDDDHDAYDFEREEGVFRQMAGLFQGKLRWMAVTAMLYGVVATVLMVLAIVRFFQADEVKWQIFYAAGALLLGELLMLVKLWGWMQMNRYALQREIKRLELRILERCQGVFPDQPGRA